MFEQVLPTDAKESLAVLGRSELLKNAYLAGGTALALQIGHRISVDFDFFTPEEFDENILIQRMQKTLPDFKLDRMEWGTILGDIGGTRFSLFYYNYPLLFKTHDFLEVKVADVKDIAPMKIAAISDRGTKRDFVDLYFLIEEEKVLSLEEALELYDKKFGLLKQNKIHILKSLCYFDDAEKGGIPKMIKDISWDKIKKRFTELVLSLNEEVLK